MGRTERLIRQAEGIKDKIMRLEVLLEQVEDAIAAAEAERGEK